MECQFFSKNVFIFFATSVLFFVSIHAFDPFLAPYIRSIKVESKTMGFIIGATGLASMLLRFPIGIISDKLFKRKLIIQIGLLFTIIAWPLAYLHPTAETLFTAKVADGVTSATWVIYNVLFVSMFPPLQAASAIALLSVASPAGSFIGIAVAGFVATEFGPESSFLVASCSALLALILTCFVNEPKIERPSEMPGTSAVKIQLHNKSVWLLGLLCALVTLVPFATRDTLTPLLAQDHGMHVASLATLSATHLFFYALSTALCAPFFYKYLGLYKTAIIGGVLQAASAIVMPLAPDMMTIFIVQALAGVGFGMISTVLSSLVILNTPAWQQSTRLGLFQSIYSAGTFLGPVLVGYIKFYFDITNGFFVVGVIAILSVLVVRQAIVMVERNSQQVVI
ncbi:TPA_asm: MFS transporter [Salmonella enterica subsp. houtenae serovar 45:g,z51:-]|uniref:MFS transporter n=1 Tax=Salmonella enterica subsp. houtenae serovar 45:g,z51:- TaxID=1967611 RepID=A0A736VCL0_SALHO|nr:MFS transporter [Salmonella enterica subsp. houtenae str. CFSAN000557]HAE7767733.1 MFS transporter [Salmonella enterica subsp. houtenae serovar 45:g,z51:-]